MNEINSILREMEAAAFSGELDDIRAEEYRSRALALLEAYLRGLQRRDTHSSDLWFRPGEVDVLRTYLVRAFRGRCRFIRPVYNHLVVRAAEEDLPGARRFAARFAACTAEFFGEPAETFVRSLSEEQILSCWDRELKERLLSTLGNCRILVIPEFAALDLRRFKIALESLGIGRFSVILCVSEDVAEEIRSFPDHDRRLGKYLLRHNYLYTENTPEDVCEHVCRQLEDGGLRLSEEFRAKLNTYVRAVYPEAILQGAPFVRDLLIRIEDTRADALRLSNTLTAEDVPFSYKAMLLEKQQNDATDPPKHESEPESAPEPEPEPEPAPGVETEPETEPEPEPKRVPEPTAEPETEAKLIPTPAPLAQETVHEAKRSLTEDISNEAFARLALSLDGGAPALKETAKKLNDRATNVLFLAMSTFPRQNDCYALQKAVFVDEDSKQEKREYIGRGQLDPVPKKIARDLAEKRQALDYIVLLCTEQTKQPESELVIQEQTQRYLIKDVSAVQFFKSQIEPYLNPETQDHFIEVDVKDDLADSVGTAVREIRKLAEASNAPDNQPKVNLFIDIHGGLRSTQMVTQSVISLLQTDANRIHTQLYTVINDIQRKSITQSDEAMRIQSFVSGITELLNYGRTTSLKGYFKTTKNKRVRNVMECLDSVADGISWCNVDQFEQGLNDLPGRLELLRNDNESGAEFLPLFEENIRNGFAGLLSDQRTVLDEIRWCLNKGFLQQTLALIEAKISLLFRDERIFVDEYGCSINGENYYKRKCEVPSEEDLRNHDSRIFQSLFNACAFFVGREARMKKRFMDNRGNANQVLTELQTKGRELVDNKLIETLSRRISPQNLPMAVTLTGWNVSFDNNVSDEAVAQFLILHDLLKDLRNDSMHVKEFKYNIPRINRALKAYLELCESMLRQRRASAAPVNQGDSCLALVRNYNADSKVYLLMLSDNSAAVLKQQDMLKKRDLKIGEQILVRVTGSGAYAKKCVETASTAAYQPNTKA